MQLVQNRSAEFLIRRDPNSRHARDDKSLREAEDVLVFRALYSSLNNARASS